MNALATPWQQPSRPPRPRTSRRLARQLDRLARRAHAFHRFAHHPLCDRYAGELIALRRRTRICRGCTAVLLAGLLGLGAGALGSAAAWCLGLLAALGVASVPAPRSAPGRSWHSTFDAARAHKRWTRALPAFCVAAAGAQLLHAPSALHGGLASALAITAVGSLARYRRRGPNRAACERCPERALAVPCSGLLPIVRAERAFVRRAQQLLDQQAAAAPLPPLAAGAASRRNRR